MKIELIMPDKSRKSFEKAPIAKDFVVQKDVVGVKVDGKVYDLMTTITTTGTVEFIRLDSPEGIEILRHSTAHVLAHAVKNLYNNVKFGVGPTIEDGFYYDFEFEEQVKDEDLKKIEEEMNKIILENQEFKRKDVTKEEAEKLFMEQPYKIELLEELNEPSIYTNGDFTDLCRGPHLPSTGYIKAFKLQRTAMVYWKGDARNDQLTRIYGTAFPDKKNLREHLHMIEEAAKKDHAKLGKKLDLFCTSELVGKGLPLLTPKGATIKRILRRWIEDEEINRGYLYTDTPVMAKSDIYKVSGHYDHYKEDMFIFDDNGEELVLRPMTCPHQFMIYKSKTRSYRDLPLRYAEMADLFRKEQSGELHGLIRIRQFVLADAHLICMPNQLEKEFVGVLDLVKYIMETLGFDDYWYRFSKWDPKDKKKYIDNPKAWEESQATMKKILDHLKLDYVEAEGEAAFYGPKLDVQMRNVYGKEDTIFTIQIDFALPERFDMWYEGEDGKKHRPMIIHRSSIGCLERTMAMLIEKTAGNFPLWLSPVQIRVLSVADRFSDYAEKVVKQMKDAGLRAESDTRSETVGKKVRNAQLEKVNYILVVGEKEEKDNTVTVRRRDGKVVGAFKVDEFTKKALEENDRKLKEPIL